MLHIAPVLPVCHAFNTLGDMKTLTVRLPESLVAEIDAESRDRRMSKSDVVRERLRVGAREAGGQLGVRGESALSGLLHRGR
jgi:Ribbon-helix-helix protein, copG family